LAFVGIGVTLALWLVVVGEVVQTQLPLTILAGVGVILLPLWFIWLGLRLRRAR
jgi:hypothetical protein